MRIAKQPLWILSVFCGLLSLAPCLSAADDAPAAKPRKPANAQAERPRDRIQAMAKELNLSEEQKGKLRAMLQKEAEKRKALRGDTSLTREARREKTKAIAEDLTAELKKVLTAEQFEKWQKMRAEQRKNAASRAGNTSGKRQQGTNP